jgi:hypothetical protein
MACCRVCLFDVDESMSVGAILRIYFATPNRAGSMRGMRWV